MIIISDSSPLSALAQMGELDLLRLLYGRVVIPETVLRECTHPRSPAGLVELLGSSDCFIDIVPDPPLLAEAGDVDPGEAAAISLGWAYREEATLIIDDRDGRKLCESLGLRITGTAGVLLAAANSGLIDFEENARHSVVDSHLGICFASSRAHPSSDENQRLEGTLAP